MKKPFKFLFLSLVAVGFSLGTAGCDSNSNEGGVAVEMVALEPSSYTISVGDEVQLTPRFYPSNASNKNVTWSVTAGASYVSVSDTGLVKGLSAGNSVVTVTTVDGGHKANCAFTVNSSGGNGGGNGGESGGGNGGGSGGGNVTPSTVPSSTTSKIVTSVSPNHSFTFEKNNSTGNWSSTEGTKYDKTIEELVPTGYEDIYQLEIILFMDFDGQNNATQYYGGELTIGYTGNIKAQEQWSESTGFWEYDDADGNADGAYKKGKLHLWFDAPTFEPYDHLFFIFTYAAKQTFTAKIEKINFYHSQGYTFQEKKVENVNKVIINNRASTGKQLVPLSVVGNGLISHFDVEYSYTSDEPGYANGVIWVEGVYEVAGDAGLLLPNSPRNNVNIGTHITPGIGVTTNDTVTIYLSKYHKVDPTGNIGFTCNWAPASNITIKSVTYHVISDGSGSGSSGGSGNGSSVVVTDTFLSEPQSPLEETLGMDQIRNAYSRCIANEGNNYLLKQAVNKMQNGNQTTIAYIGGSVTEGDAMPNSSDKITDIPGKNYSASWAYWSYKFFASKYGTGSNVKYLNAAMSGTGSDLGIARFKKDVLDNNPSIVFIEFAVNNDTRDLDKQTYEDMIRMALKDSNKPAVVLAMSWTYYSGGQIENYATALGEKYNLPVISIHKGLNPIDPSHNNFYNSFVTNIDGQRVHPTLNGHKLYAKLIGYGITTIADKDSDSQISAIPSAQYTDRYDTMRLYQREDDSVSVSGFSTSSPTVVAATNKSDQVSGQGGWQLYSGNGTLSMTTSAKAVFVLYCSNQYDGSNGTINVTISGGHSASKSQNILQDRNGNAGWGNVCVLPVLEANETKNCSISVSLQGKGQIIGIAVAN